MRGRQTPAHLRPSDPSAQSANSGFGQVKTGAERRNIQQIQHLADRQAGTRQIEQLF